LGDVARFWIECDCDSMHCRSNVICILGVIGWYSLSEVKVWRRPCLFPFGKKHDTLARVCIKRWLQQ
jgi:hypothetical protein